jgi:trimethylamine--corrinoid protein Co-methyltransferase
MDCEIFSLVDKIIQGIAVDDESLALDVIAAVGPSGNFLAQTHTRRHMRDLFLPEFMDRRPSNEWASRKDDARDWALAKARKLLAEHRPEPLDPALSRELERLIASIEVRT